ncbi:MAG TPA: glycoside hydrolase family 3 N-terminal domain-containing protein [Candidatus Hydrogenedens sp.]|nr:glycoside hydrolase family 3 N-terminal domain-containing protein [Candidatus Hydrogenedens sp.]
MFLYFIFLMGILGADNEAPLPEAIKSDEIQIHEKEKTKDTDNESPSKEKKAEDELRLKISQLFLITLQGTHGTLLGDRNFLSQYTPAGVVIPQIIEPKRAEEYIAGLRFSVRNEGLPLWLAGDLYDVIERERGAPSPYINLPPLLALSANPDPTNIEKIIRLWKSYIQGLKLNMMLGPHLSLASLLPKAHSNLHSLGSNAQTASEVAVQMFKLWNLPKILMVPMDFPGGQTNREGIQPAVLLTPEQYLIDNDILPYKLLIDKGCPIIHVGTTLVPTLDPQGKPACISKAVIHDWLRSKLNFKGVIIAGPLDAPEVLQFMDPSESALEALRNGADVLYYRGPSNTAGRAIDRVYYAVQHQEISTSQIEEAYTHIKTLKDIQFSTQDTSTKGEKEIKPTELTKTGGDIFDNSYYILKNSITLVRNNGNVLPLTKGSVAGIGITGAVGVKELDEYLRKYHKNIGLQPMPSSLRLGYLQNFEIERAEKNIGKAPIVICIVVSTLRLLEQEELINRLKEKGSKVVAIVLGHPKALSCAKKADAILIAYAEPPAYQIAIKAISETLVGFPAFRFRSIMHDISLKPNQPYTFSLKELIAIPPGKLPLSVGEDFPEGASLSFPVDTMIKKCEWTIQGKDKFKEPSFTFTFPSPGEYTVDLQVQGPDKQVQTKTYALTVK